MSDTKRLVIFNSVLVLVVCCVLLGLWKPSTACAQSGEGVVYSSGVVYYSGNGHFCQ